ncbi:MAG: hypothetical protein M3112_10165 [Actinomycetia bacterium]|nr:hypothetical protein [Actinomycetes bacterium]
MTEDRNADPLRSGLQKAAMHFSKAAIEVVSGVADLVNGITSTVRPSNSADDTGEDGPQRIEIE